jgi:adenosylcobinamide-GDP ribazoletransferase
MRTFLAAASFLTVLPPDSKNPPPGRAVIFFPLLGALIGAAGAGLFKAASMIVPAAAAASFAALITVLFWTLISRSFHRRNPAIYLLLALSVIVRWQALQYAPAAWILEFCILSQTIPRTAIVALAWLSRPSAAESTFAFSSSLTTTGAILAIAQGVAISMLLGWRTALLILAGAYLVIRGAQAWFNRRTGGVDGDSFTIVQHLLEAYILVLLAAT